MFVISSKKYHKTWNVNTTLCKKKQYFFMSRKKGYSEILSKLVYVREEKRSSYLRYFKEKKSWNFKCKFQKTVFFDFKKKRFSETLIDGLIDSFIWFVFLHFTAPKPKPYVFNLVSSFAGLRSLDLREQEWTNFFLCVWFCGRAK